MTEDLYIVAIAALLPLTAGMLILQVNPYHALVIRGILGAIAALIYALFGAADVALTEALVGTMLSITLYAVAVRSSLSMRLGVLEPEMLEHPYHTDRLLSVLQQISSKYHMRLELVTYTNLQALQSALTAKEIHTTSILTEQVIRDSDAQPVYCLQTRVLRLYEVMLPELPANLATLSYYDSDRVSTTQYRSTIGISNLENQL